MGSNGQVKLKEIANFQNGGGWTADKYSDSGIPVVRVSDIYEETIDLSDCKYLPTSLWDKYNKHELKEDDLVICTVGSHPTQPGSVVGRSCRVPANAEGAVLNQNAVRIRPTSKNLDKKYLSYLGASDLMRNYIIAHARGSANQVRMSITNLKNFSFELPSIQVQQKIASILSAFDDLIENNSRRIEILEEMARRIYREWFVHFRYPGHENDELVDSGTELGEIPEDWEMNEVDDIVNRLSKGNIYRKKNTDDEGEIIIIDQSTDEYLGFHNNEPDFPASPGEPYIIFGDHTCKMQLLLRPFSLGPNVVPFIAEDENLSNYYLYYLLDPIIESREYKRHWTTFKVKKVAVAPTELANNFENKIRPLIEQKEILKKQINRLKETRDLLLPKLISGKIDVKEININ